MFNLFGTKNNDNAPENNGANQQGFAGEWVLVRVDNERPLVELTDESGSCKKFETSAEEQVCNAAGFKIWKYDDNFREQILGAYYARPNDGMAKGIAMNADGKCLGKVPDVSEMNYADIFIFTNRKLVIVKHQMRNLEGTSIQDEITFIPYSGISGFSATINPTLEAKTNVLHSDLNIKFRDKDDLLLKLYGTVNDEGKVCKQNVNIGKIIMWISKYMR